MQAIAERRLVTSVTRACAVFFALTPTRLRPALRNLVRIADWAASPLLSPLYARAPADNECTAEQAMCHPGDLNPYSCMQLCRGVGSRLWRQRPLLVAHDVGQVKSYGVAAHRRRAWLGGGSSSPRNRPRAVSLSVGSLEPGSAFDFSP
jgi:hypothetical protein